MCELSKPKPSLWPYKRQYYAIRAIELRENDPIERKGTANPVVLHGRGDVGI